MDFNYTQFHLFDKHGNELPLAYSTTCKVVIPNSNPAGDDAVFFAVINHEDIKYDEDGKTIESVNASYHKITGGSRFTKVPVTGYVEINGAKFKTAISVNTKSYKTSSSYSSETESLSVDSVNSVDLSSVYEFIETPTVTFTGGVSFDRVSTNLVETESLYVLVKDADGDFVKASDSTAAKTWFDRYKLLFFIDTRNDEDFRFFRVTNSDEIEWTNKIIVDCTSADDEDESSYRVNIGFTSTEEGVHEGVITVCVIDTETTMDDGYNRIYPIGSINLQAEAIGEDERYRTLFANFGIPDPLTYYDSFCNIDPDEGYTDNIILNQNSKRMFLAYPDIFPYLGTYKALINAVNALGYQDLFFKEWYSNTGAETSQGKYTIYDVEYGQPTSNLNIINNLTTSERVKLKKLNWLSMMYKINEVVEESSDSSDSTSVYKSSEEVSLIGDHSFPTVVQVNSYNNSDLLVKLTSLRSWLEKFIIGLNCRIVDITGEGIYFERYRLDSYGSYQTILEWNNEKNIAPYVTNVHDDNVLVDSSAYIYVNLGIDEGTTTFEDIKHYRYIDFCEGYIDAESTYHAVRTNTSDEDGSIFVGGSLEYLRGSDMFELKASSTTDSFMFNSDFIKSDDGETRVSSNLRVTGNEIFFNPYDLYKGYPKTTVFTKLPIIQLERANLRSSGEWGTSVLYSIYPDVKDDTTESYVIENTKTHDKQTTIDYVTLVPPAFEESEEEITITAYVSAPGSDGKKTVAPVKTTLSKIIDPGVVSDFEAPVKEIKRLNYMYGLKYSSDNVYRMPMFSVIGYQADHVDHNIPADREMYLEILDGKMLFLDQENNREIYLNFNFDDSTGEQSVTVNIIYHSDEFWVSQYKYTDDIGEHYFKHFVEGGSYEKFVEAYSADPDNVISHEFTHKIKVNNTGKFLVDVFERDMHNNIFAANCDNYGNIIMPHFDLLEYSNVKGGELVTDLHGLKDNFIDFCIYSPAVMANGISVKTDSGLSIEYPTYSYGLHNLVRGDYVHATDITDMYRVDAVDDIQNTLSGSKGTAANFESFNLVLSPAMVKRYNRVLDSDDMYGAAMIYNSVVPKYSAIAEYSDDESGNKMMISGRLTDYLKLYADGDENFADVNVIFYNELNSHPVYQTYGTLSSDQIFSGGSPYNGKYRLVVQDYSGNAYIWADLLLCTKSALILQLTDVMNGLFSGTDSVRQAEYYLSEYVFKTMKDSSAVGEISADAVEDLINVSALTGFINDCSTYSVYTSDDCPADKDATIDFHMPGGKITNILYDLEAFVVEDDDELEAETSSKLYDDYIKKDADEGSEGTAKFENILNNIINSGDPGSRLYDYMSSLSYEECSEYLKICTDAACKASRECIIGEKTSSDILRTICELYAEEFVTDDETAKIYETSVDVLTGDGTVSKNVISKICNDVEFDDLKNADSLAEAFASAIRPFGERIESGGINYYISCLYGVMVYISTVVLQYIIGEAEKYSCKYGEVNSELSLHVYNRFCTVFNFVEKTDGEDTDIDDSSTNKEDADINEIRSAAVSILAAFANTIYAGYVKESEAEGISQSGISVKSALSDKIFDNSITGQLSIYNKLINNAAWQSYTEMSDAGWVFMNTLEYNDEIDDMTEENSRARCKFAVISGDEHTESESLKKHYVKTAEYGDDGYSEVTNDVPMAASVSIMDIIKRPYISTYIKPIWKSNVNAYILDSSTAENLGLDLNYDYLCVGYKKSLFSNRFKRGEKVKLIFQPVGQSEYFGQSTYEVVGYDIANNYMILKGSINRAYINNDGEELWGYLPVEDGYAYIPGTGSEASETFRDVIGTTDENGSIIEINGEIMTKVQVTESTKYITVSYTMSGNTLLLTVPVKYVKDDSEADGYWMYKLYGYNNISAPSAVMINASKIEKMNIYISYAHHGFVDYPMKSTGFNENSDGVTEIEIENTDKNRKFMDFMDDTFSISGRSFDIDAGVYNWMSGVKNDNTLNGGTPDIMKSLTSIVYLRKNEFTEMDLPDTNIVIASDSDGVIDESTSYKYWKVYYNNGDGNSELLFESYNPELYLAPKERGIYDIEATIYDRYGNESTHMYKGACIVK